MTAAGPTKQYQQLTKSIFISTPCSPPEVLPRTCMNVIDFVRTCMNDPPVDWPFETVCLQVCGTDTDVEPGSHQ